MTTIADVTLARVFGKRYASCTPEEELLFAAYCIENRHLSYAQRLQDLWVLYEMGEKSGTFVDFGAGNGRDSSNSFILHRKFNWNGLLVEPNADYLDNLNYHTSPGVIVKTGLCIVGDRNTKEVDFVVSSDPSISTLHYTIDTDGHGGLRRHLPSEVRKLEAMTLSELLIQNQLFPVDYLSIDTEGSEYDILKEFFEEQPAYPKFKLITVEHNYNVTKRKMILDLLSSQGYVQRFQNYSGHDDWFIQLDFLKTTR